MAFIRSIILICILEICFVGISYGGNFYKDVDITWGDGRAKINRSGNQLTLSLDKFEGSGFQSKNNYLFGRFDMQIKLVKGNSAGTVTAYYLKSEGESHDEIDFEFLGNLSGQPYVVHTNIYTRGQGNREQQFYLWFDPTKEFHTYSILWNPRAIIFYIDGIPIRVFPNRESKGIPFPNHKPMKVYASLWNADDWATQGGRVKTDWKYSPFTAYFRNFKVNACIWSNGVSSCKNKSYMPWLNQELDSSNQVKLKWVQKNYMIYNYCLDIKRFPRGLPHECTIL
ncbi:unnamed protein product [Amaranthus hypochondriacus]